MVPSIRACLSRNHRFSIEAIFLRAHSNWYRIAAHAKFVMADATPLRAKHNVSNRAGHSARMLRKRAQSACLYCRARKVRCDVALDGLPCTNCRLDAQDCVVPPRARKWWVRPAALIMVQCLAADYFQKAAQTTTRARLSPRNNVASAVTGRHGSSRSCRY